MNGHWSPYCAYNKNGTRRNAAHSQKYYKLAFRRIYLLMHGGTADTINAKLAAWGLPGIKRDLPVNPYPTVRVVWNPQGFGSPNVRGNMPSAYWPGAKYVDVVGDDLYDIRGSAAWAAADALYNAHPSKPFAFPEWGLWGIDDPSFVRHMARFVKNHRRVEMIAFFNGKAGSIFDIATKAASRAAYRNYITPLGR
jgi:beta-mannanase